MAPTVVVKCGGAEGIQIEHICADIAAVMSTGTTVVLVHGGSATVEELAGRLGVPSRELVSPSGITSRFTDSAMLEVVTLALVGKVKSAFLVELAKRGVPALGLSGLDAGLLRAQRKKAVRSVVDGRTVLVRDDHSGRLRHVATPIIRTVLDAGLLPVISSPALAEDGEPVNVNADRVAAAVAMAIGADTLMLLTAAPGVLADPADETTVIADYEVAPGSPAPDVHGGMAIKLIAAGEALDQGVGTVVIADARVPAPIRAALDGAGTRIRLAARAGQVTPS